MLGTGCLSSPALIYLSAAGVGIPRVRGSVLGHEAQLSVFFAGRGPVYEGLFPALSPLGSVPSRAQAGVLGPLVGMTGSALAMEVLKLITGLGEPLVGRLACLDSLTMSWGGRSPSSPTPR